MPSFESYQGRKAVHASGPGASGILTNEATEKFQRKGPSVGGGPWLVGLGRTLINDLAVENRHRYFGFADALRWQTEDVFREDNDVGQHVARERAFAVLVERRPRGVPRVGVDGLLDRQSLRGNPAAFGFALDASCG